MIIKVYRILWKLEKNLSDDLDNVLKESQTNLSFARNVAKASSVESGSAQE